MNPIRYEFLRSLIVQSPVLPSGGRIIAVDGRSGAGKTTLAEGIAAMLACPVLTVDELCPGWDGLGDVPELLAALLAPLARGQNGSYRRYDWLASALDGCVELSPTPWLVVDGVGSGSRACRPYLSLLIWIEADAAGRKKRALARDGETFAQVWDRWAAQESRLLGLEKTAEAADVVLTANTATGILGLRPTT